MYYGYIETILTEETCMKDNYPLHLPYREKTKQEIPCVLTKKDIERLKGKAKLESRPLKSYVARILKEIANS